MNILQNRLYGHILRRKHTILTDSWRQPDHYIIFIETSNVKKEKHLGNENYFILMF
jgi:hypothetical protein